MRHVTTKIITLSRHFCSTQEKDSNDDLSKVQVQKSQCQSGPTLPEVSFKAWLLPQKVFRNLILCLGFDRNQWWSSAQHQSRHLEPTLPADSDRNNA